VIGTAQETESPYLHCMMPRCFWKSSFASQSGKKSWLREEQSPVL